MGPKRLGPVKSAGCPLLSKKSAAFRVGDGEADEGTSADGKLGAEHALIPLDSYKLTEGGDGQDRALQDRLKTVYAQSKQWGIENRRLRESIARGDIVVVHEQLELCLADQGT